MSVHFFLLMEPEIILSDAGSPGSSPGMLDVAVAERSYLPARLTWLSAWPAGLCGAIRGPVWLLLEHRLGVSQHSLCSFPDAV